MPIGFSKLDPVGKTRKVRILKVQLGLSCNYSCDYCSQRFVERAPETSKKHIDEFMAMLDGLEFSEKDGLKIEFWGGEPLVYWKTLKPLAEAIREKYDWMKPIDFSIITNGSLLNDEICDWLYEMGFSVGISHDGPGQHVRGPDPLDDPEKRQTILAFYKRMKGRISFNAMLNAQNMSRRDIHQWFIDFTGDPDVPLGEGELVDAYDEGGAANSLSTKAQHFAFRKRAFQDIFQTEGRVGFGGIVHKVDEFINSVLDQRPAHLLGQKCGMDRDDIIATDLRGNVLTCQNVSAVETSFNGESHKIGSLSDIDSIKLKTATHWSRRERCSACPVIHLCKGACMFLEGEHWDTSCANAYSNNVSLFALAFAKITGCVPTFISGGLPDDRADIWGDLLEHPERVKPKAFPVKVVAERRELDGVSVFSKSVVEEV